MLAEYLLPRWSKPAGPHILHLLAFILLLHQLIVEIIRNTVVNGCPYYRLGTVGKAFAGKIRRRILLLPGYVVDDLEPLLLED